jgi:hypothetical protein
MGRTVFEQVGDCEKSAFRPFGNPCDARGIAGPEDSLFRLVPGVCRDTLYLESCAGILLDTEKDCRSTIKETDSCRITGLCASSNPCATPWV